MIKFLKAKANVVMYSNDLDAWVPEIWAAETLAILEENMVIGRLIHTDFKDEVKNFGDVVNTRRPGTFTAERKTANDDVTIQDADATNVAVPLDQHIHTSFLIRDGQESLSFEDLVEEYMAPAALSLAQMVDRILLGQVYQFQTNTVGILGSLSSSTIKDTILDARQKMNENNAHVTGRNLILGTTSETTALKEDMFLSAEQVGDDGTALREASLGRKLGFDVFMSQNTAGTTVAAGTGNADELASSAVVGATALTLDGSVLDNGQYFWLEGDGQANYVASGGGTTSVVAGRALKADVAAGASNLFEVTAGLVDLSGHTSAGGPSTYPAGYSKRIKVDGSGTPHIGQVVNFSTVSSAAIVAGEYSIVAIPASGYIVLDRPLDLAIANNYVINYGPRGDFNFAFHRNALTLVTRPLAKPKAGTGALAGVANFNGLSMRVVITYQGVGQGHLVTMDLLAGVKVLDTNLGCVIVGGEYTETYA
ncbi:hypothetical protein LCGC14_1023800 [marine sediment metagenome]|uniref:Uncharacterized protein n=1 Tax=marine sediment metagenome TaxID=412755 RepID=A0A0F9R2G3_9ZZZZ